jgi:hypothetical protein
MTETRVNKRVYYFAYPGQCEEAAVGMIDLSKLAEELVAIFDRLAAEHEHKKAEEYMNSGIGSLLNHILKTRPECDEPLSGKQLADDICDKITHQWVSFLIGPDGGFVEMRAGDSQAEVEGPLKDRIAKGELPEGHFTIRTRPPLATH